MTQVRINEISGGTYPVDIFIADVYGNNKSLIGTILSGPVPPTVSYNTVIPSIFDTAPEVMLLMIDSVGCEVFKILNCDEGCAFEITIILADCEMNVTISKLNP